MNIRKIYHLYFVSITIFIAQGMEDIPPKENYPLELSDNGIQVRKKTVYKNLNQEITINHMLAKDKEIERALNAVEDAVFREDIKAQYAELIDALPLIDSLSPSLNEEKMKQEVKMLENGIDYYFMITDGLLALIQ